MGLEIPDITPYVIRRGARTHGNNQVTGPSEVVWELRMGHFIGGARAPYIHPCLGSDGWAGRILSLLPPLLSSFAVLPPQFDKDLLTKITPEFLSDIIPGYNSLPVEFLPTLPFLLASLFFHENYLKSIFPNSHPLWLSRVFSNNILIADMRKIVMDPNKLKLVQNDIISATGVPPHILHNIRMENLESAVEGLNNKMCNFEVLCQTTLPSAVANSVVTEISNNLVVNGAVPVTMRDFSHLKFM